MTNPEVLLISAVINTGDYQTPFTRGITHQLFHTFQDEWRWLENYISSHKRTPSKEAFKSKFPRTRTYKATDVDHFVEEVKAGHVRHSLINMLSDIGQGIKTEEPPSSLLDRIHKESLSIQSDIEGESTTYEVVNSWKDTFQDVIDRFDRVQSLGSAGIPTGFKTLDLVTGGIHPGHYWVLAGRLGQGKTWIAVRMAVTAMLQGMRVQYFSLEQSRHQIAMRIHTLLSSEVGKQIFRSSDLNTGKGVDLVAYKQFLGDMKDSIDGRFFINDQSRGSVTPLTVAAVMERNKPDVVFLDYLTLMEQKGNPKDDDWLSIGKLSKAIKQITERYGIPVVVLSQINRSGSYGNDPPGTEHLSRSDSIGQDADAVVTLKQMSTHTAKLRLAKYRHGRDGVSWWCKFNPNVGELIEISGDKANEIRLKDKEAQD